MLMLHSLENIIPHWRDLFGEILPRHFGSGLQSSELEELTRNIDNNKDGFGVKLDVKNFRPEEITVKTVGHSIVIEAKHEERREMAGFISRHIVRRYELPEDYKPEAVISYLSSDGVLVIKCPKSETVEGVPVREVPILQVGRVRLTKERRSEEEIAPTNEEEIAPTNDTEEKLDEKK